MTAPAAPSRSRARVAVAARLARREVRRHPWRHLLVVALIFVPVLSALGAFSAVATWQGIERRQNQFDGVPPGTWGTDTTDVVAAKRLPLDEHDPRVITDLGLPAGSTIETSWIGADWLVTGAERSDGEGPKLAGTKLIEAEEGSAASRQLVVEDGHLPRSSDEIFLTTPLAATGGWSIGDTVELARGGVELRVVGTGVDGSSIDASTAAVGELPTSYWTDIPDALTQVELTPGHSVWAGPHQAVVARVPEGYAGPGTDRWWWSGASRSDVDGRVGPGLTLAAAAICAVVAVVASAAFAISSRRQLRSVGLLSTVGADPGTIRWAMVLQGAIPGAVAGAAAVIVGLAAAAIINAQGWAEQVSEVSGAQAVVSPAGAAIAVLLGLFSGIAAAWQPARTVSRIPTLSALAGRRPLGPVPARVPMTGLLLWVGGAILLVVAFSADVGGGGLGDQLVPFLLIGGVAAMALGAVGLAPAFVALLNPIAQRCRGTARMSLRGLARHRTQSAATVAAIAVVLALPVGLLTTRDAIDTRSAAIEEARVGTGEGVTASTSVVPPSVSVLRTGPRPAQVMISGALRSDRAATLEQDALELLGPDAGVIRTIPIVDQDGAWQKVAIVDDDVAGRVLAPWAAEAVAAGKAISLVGGDPQVTFTADGEQAGFDVADSPEGSYLHTIDANYVVGSAAMGNVGSHRPSDSVALVRPEPVTSAEATAIEDLVPYSPELGQVPTLDEVQRIMGGEDLIPDYGPDEQVHVTLLDDEGDGSSTAVTTEDLNRERWNRALLAATAVATALALLVLTITLSLRAVDGEADLRAAFAAGVAPARLRRQRAFEGVVLALMGAVLAVPLGWLPVTAARLGADSNLRSAQRDHLGSLISLPGWEVIPILLAPAVLAAVLWTVFPALGAAIRTARHPGPTDELLPRF